METQTDTGATSDEPDQINTPETLGATPKYVLQHNAVSRGAHGMSATAQKLIAMAMSLLPPDLSSRTAAFTFAEFCNAMGMPGGGETYKIFKSAVDECMECIITLETEPDEKGKKAWKKFTWFTVSTFDERTGHATMKFSDELAGFLLALKWMYAKIDLKDIGELQSRYAIKLFEIAMSYMSLKGKQGNPEQCWYFERLIPELRDIMGVPKEAYKEMNLFKQKVIDGPIKELNEAGIGLEITPTGIKQGRRIVSIRFECRQSRRAAGRKSRGAKAEPHPEQDRGIGKEQRKEEAQYFRERYPDEFDELFQQKLAGIKSIGSGEGLRNLAAEMAALDEFKKRRGIRK